MLAFARMEKEKKEIPESEVIAKISFCQECNGMVRAAIKHTMNRKSKNEFAKEVMEYNLAVKEISLIEYRKNVPDFCKC